MPCAESGCAAFLEVLMNMKTRTLVECSAMIALATVLSFIKIDMPLGGGVTLCSMLPLVLIARRHGTAVGLITAFVHGLIQMLIGLDNVQYATSLFMAFGIIVCDYIAAYAVIGLSSVFAKGKHAETKPLIVGMVLSMGLRLLFHFISGWWIWEALWPNEFGMIAPLWSFVYNAGYMIPEIVLTCVAAWLINTKTKLLDRINEGD